jgi:hypothetical protein
MKALTAREANRLAIEFQIILIKALETALSYTFRGDSLLWGKRVAQSDLARAKETLAQLDRARRAHENESNVPYFACNGASEGKTKVHYSTSGAIKFVEVKEGGSADGVERHLNSKQVVTKQIRKQFSTNNNPSPSNVEATTMATKKKAAKKTATKAAKKAFKGSRTAQQFRDDYDKNPAGFNVAEYAQKHDVAYYRVYGAIVKHVGGAENVGKKAPKVSKAPAAAPKKKATKKAVKAKEVAA